MKLSDSLSYAFDYTKGLFSKGWDLIILTILSIIPIVNLITIGYFGRVIKDNGASKQPPKVEGYWNMFVGGLKACVAAFIWSLPIIILAIIVIIVVALPLMGIAALQNMGNIDWSQFNQTWQSGNWTHLGGMMRDGFWAPRAAVLLAMIPAVLLIIALAIIIWFFAMTGIVHMFKSGSFGKAFAVGEIYNIIRKIGLLKYLGLIAVAIILGAIIGIFEAIPVIGWLISAFLSLLLMIFLSRTIGLLYDDALGTTAGASESIATAPHATVLPVQEAVAEKATEATEKVFCVHCGVSNKIASKFCYKCGKELERP